METDNNIEQLISIIPDYPAQRIMHFVDEPSNLMELLSNLCLDREYEYQILCNDCEAMQSAKEKYPQNLIKIRQVSLCQARYHIQAKMYDYIFVELEIADKKHFVKTVYSAMKNAANIFILRKKGEKTKEEEWRKALEENFFVAYSAFDLDEHYRIISAKKMHGWGG